VKISEVKADYYEASSKVSDIVRQLSFAGIAVVWIFRVGDKAGGMRYTPEMVHPLGLFVISLGLDLFQYTYKTVALGALNYFSHKKHPDDETDIAYPSKLNWVTNILFVGKAGACILAFGFLLHLIYGQFNVKAAELPLSTNIVPLVTPVTAPTGAHLKP